MTGLWPLALLASALALIALGSRWMSLRGMLWFCRAGLVLVWGSWGMAIAASLRWFVADNMLFGMLSLVVAGALAAVGGPLHLLAAKVQHRGKLLDFTQWLRASTPELWRVRLARSAVPVLLLGVAVVQLVRVETQDLARWKGGGFGMFSTVSERFMHIRVSNDAGDNRAAVDWYRWFSAQDVRAARKYPVAKSLEPFAKTLDGFQWLVRKRDMHGKNMTVARRSRASRARSASEVWVQIWDVEFRAHDGWVRPVLIREVRRARLRDTPDPSVSLPKTQDTP